MPELVLEVRCQEMAPKLADRLLRRLGGRLFEELMSQGLGLSEMLTGSTPRRLALAVRGLPEHGVEREKVRFGPVAEEAWDREGRPTEALEAFAAECEVPATDLVRRSTERGERSAWVTVEPGEPIRLVLEPLLTRLLQESAEIESGFGEGVWPRPVTGLLAVVDGEVMSLELDGHTATARSMGHPIFSPTSFEVTDWESYRDDLEQVGILVSREERRTDLRARAEELAERYGGRPMLSPALLDRWASSCEITGLMGGEIPPEALTLPSEWLVTALAERQGAAVVGRGDEALPFFLAAMDRSDDPEGRVVDGRRRALTGDVQDALMSYERDRRLPLVQRVRRLEQLIFHGRLGTYADKSQRLRELVEVACGDLGWQDVQEHALEAAELSKADLTTLGVEALPSLHGVLGGILAREEGYVEPVWQAIYDHTRPHGEDGELPRGRPGLVLAVADRLGSLVGLFGLGEDEPDGRRRAEDPHGLRSLADGLLRLVLEGGLRLDLDLLAARAVLLYGDRLTYDAESILRRLQSFLDRRLDHRLAGRGFGADEIEAAKAVGTRDLPDLLARLEGLRALRGDAGLAQLAAAARRMSKIVADAPEGVIEPELLQDGAERVLFDHLAEVGAVVERAVSQVRYADALVGLIALAPALEAFFAEVLILDEDERIRTHRLALVQSARRLCWRVARLAALHVVVEEKE